MRSIERNKIPGRGDWNISTNGIARTGRGMNLDSALDYAITLKIPGGVMAPPAKSYEEAGGEFLAWF